jgi:hypothetical protein
MRTRDFVGALSIVVAGCVPSARQIAVPVVPAFDQTITIPSVVQLDSPVSRLEPGTTIPVSLMDTLTSRRNQVGEVVAAVVNGDVRDRAGLVVIPAGSEAQLKIAAFQAPTAHQDDARMLFEITSATVGGQTYALPSTGAVSVKADVKDFMVKPGARMEFRLAQAVVLQAS